MKKILSYFFLISFGLSPALADTAPVISRAIPVSKPAVDTAAAPAVVARTAIGRSVVVPKPVVTDEILEDKLTDIQYITTQPASRAVATSDAATVSNRAASRVTTVMPTDNPRAGAVASRTVPVTSRSVMTGNTVQSGRENLETVVNTVGRNARVSAASINSLPAVRRAGLTLRPSTAEVGGRATIAGTNVQTGSNVASEARSVNARAAAIQTKETITEAKERLQQTADLNKSCQEQYNDCMDQFCAVIDANQKRCSCSSNLSRYTKVESAVKDANSQLNDVAQRIRYVGLSADEIRAIMSSTEAEDVLSGTSDNTESRNMLEEIEKLIKNPASATSSYSGDSFSSLDMDLDFTSGGSDLFNLDFLNSASSSFSNLRGTDLYNAAKKRCNTVLSQCKGAGATTQQITGNYDLAIDKDCIAYEQGLSKMNDTLKTNVRSANQMLQKARLAVLQNKNQYDAKGCISALNTCMVDDMVCGADYTKCLDPTKKYIDENGKVVLGQNVSDITAFMKSYNNALINRDFLSQSKTVNLSACTAAGNNDGKCIVRYLLEKIGTGTTVTDGGLCRAVLDKCQRYSYNTSNAYDPYNEVIVNYIQRAMVNIQSGQQKIISDYASSCMVDIASCYNQQVSQVNSWSSTASINSIYNVMRGACRNVALTCSYAVFASDKTLCPVDDQNACINNISEMFYQSLLCPDNSSYQATSGTTGESGYVNERCKCDTGYIVWGKTCSLKCGSPGTYRNSQTGQCDSCPGGTYSSTGLESGSCPICPSGSYCPKGSASPKACPSGKTSAAGSSAESDCK